MGLILRTGQYGSYWGNTYDSSNYCNRTKQKVNATYIWSYFEPKGWSLNAVSAMLGNMQSESSINPRKVAVR